MTLDKKPASEAFSITLENVSSASGVRASGSCTIPYNVLASHNRSDGYVIVTLSFVTGMSTAFFSISSTSADQNVTSMLLSVFIKCYLTL